MLKEVSSGGLVVRDGKLLLIRVKNLQGEIVWTFPKGHIEAGEGCRQAALREVEEETGWACRITNSLPAVRYRFRREGREVSKQVKWYAMAPLKKVGGRDAHEVMACRWVSFRDVSRWLSYPSDIKLVRAFFKKNAP